MSAYKHGSAASSANATDIAPLGYKVTLDEALYKVVLPKGMKKPRIRNALIGWRGH